MPHPAAVILFVLGFSSRGFTWVHGALFSAMIASTDALAATAILKQGAQGAGGRQGGGMLGKGSRPPRGDACNVRSPATRLEINLHKNPDTRLQAAAQRSWWS